MPKKKSVLSPAKLEQSRERLAIVARLLRKSGSRARDQAAAAIESYLAGNVRTLGQAFGVEPGRGRPVDDRIRKRDIILAEKIAYLRIEKNLTWTKVADFAADNQWPVSDEGSLRRLYNNNLSVLDRYIKPKLD